MSRSQSRSALVDVLRAVASQLIVLHHLAFYGPMSDVAQSLAPDLIAWLSRNGRFAVQVFLVLAGFLAAKSLAPDGRLRSQMSLPSLVWQRYLRLAVPYIVMLLLAMAAAALARRGMQHDAIPDAPKLLQFIAHVFLMQDLLNFDALSAGVWYVAIDWQLFALFAALMWCAARVGGRCAGVGLVVAVGLASLFYFNLNPDWDDSALYFFGAYGFGTCAWWASREPNARTWLACLALVGVAALIVDFRIRIAIALSVALLLGHAVRLGWLSRGASLPGVEFLGKISYGVFLIHFPVVLLTSMFFSHLAPDVPEVQALGMLAAWVCSVICGAIFHFYVEQSVMRWLARPRGSRFAFGRS